MDAGLSDKGVRYAERLLTEMEFERFQSQVHPAAFLAKRFAAKEALVKALGTGFRDGITWKHVGVVNDALGAPRIVLSGPAEAKASALGVQHIHLSLTDETHYALAFVVLES